jgi:hypothetical protein
MNPALDGGGMLAKPVGDIIATMTVPNEQHAVQPMVVTRFIGTTDLLLERNSHGFRISNLECFHAKRYGTRTRHIKHNMLHYL